MSCCVTAFLNNSLPNMFALMFALLVFCLLRLTLGSLVYPVTADDGTQVIYDASVNFYSSLKWNMDFKYTDMPLVDICYDRNVFDYCDLTKYSIKGVESLLHAHHINSTIASGKWVAVISIYNLVIECMTKVSLSNDDQYDLYWVKKYSKYIQSTGKINI